MFAQCSSMRHKRSKGNFHIPSIILHSRGPPHMTPCVDTIVESPMGLTKKEDSTMEEAEAPTKEETEAPTKEDTEAPTKEETEAPTKEDIPIVVDAPDNYPKPSTIEQVIHNINLEVSRATEVQSQPTDADDFVILSEEDLLPSVKPVRCTAIVPYGLIKKAEWRLLRYIVAQLKSLTPRLLAHAIIYYYGGSGGSLMIYLISRALQLGLL